MRVLILISGVFFLANIVLYLLPTDIETSNLKYASDPEVNQSKILFLVEQKVKAEPLDIESLPDLSDSKEPDYTKGYIAGSATKKTNTSVCYRVGPFLRETRLKTAGKQLDEMFVDHSLIERQPISVSATRVYVGPFAGASEAVAARKQLTKDGINDHFHRRENDGTYVVSLGIYSKKDSAVNQREKFRARNIAAQTRDEQTRLPKNYWLELSTFTDPEKIQSLSTISWGESSVSVGRHPCQSKT